MRAGILLQMGLIFLLVGCTTDLERSRRITRLDIPESAKVMLVDVADGLFYSEVEVIIELSPEAYALLVEEALTKGYKPIDATVDSIVLGQRIGPDGLYYRKPDPVTSFILVVMDAKTHRILARYSEG